jgi:hypothetical protein
MGDPLEQRRESYVEAALTASSCRLLTLFALFGPGAELDGWEGTGKTWRIATADGVCAVELGERSLFASIEGEPLKAWRVRLDEFELRPQSEV